jgi:RHS repeat-associated protein
MTVTTAVFLKGSTTLASLEYTRNKDSQITKTKPTGFVGGEVADKYDENSRLTKDGSNAYKYDAANNPTTIRGGAATYDAGSELEKLGTATYTYNALGERTAASGSPGTTYAYDQAGNLIAATRTGSFEDTYGYNGDGLRQSQTKSGTVTYDAWDTSGELPLILSDGTYTYIYGAEGLPLEQISSEGAVTYLHHDAQGSTRLLTSAGGASAGTITYDAYGSALGGGTALGYDGQYTDTDTGLIYLRARYYDPATAQFMTIDPAVFATREAYEYAADDPLTRSDASGEIPKRPRCHTNCWHWKTKVCTNYAKKVRAPTGSNYSSES